MKGFNRTNITGIVITVLTILIVVLPQVEAEAQGATIQTIGDSVWYAVVTLTTVGYGGKAPVTPWGKVIGSVFVLASLGVLGLLIDQLGSLISSYREERRLGHHGYDGSGHVVLLGWNGLIEDVVEQLLDTDRDLVVVSDTKSDVDEMHEMFPTDRVFPLYSGYDDVETLSLGGLEQSARIMVGVKDDTTTLLSLLNLKRRLPDATFVVESQSENLLQTFRGAGVDHAVSTDWVASTIVAGLIFEPDAAEYVRDLMTADPSDEGEGTDIQEYRIDPGTSLEGTTYGDAFEMLVGNYNVVPIALAKRSGGRDELIRLPKDDVTLEVGDYLVVVLKERREDTLEQEVFARPQGTL